MSTKFVATATMVKQLTKVIHASYWPENKWHKLEGKNHNIFLLRKKVEIVEALLDLPAKGFPFYAVMLT